MLNVNLLTDHIWGTALDHGKKLHPRLKNKDAVKTLIYTAVNDVVNPQEVNDATTNTNEVSTEVGTTA